MSLLLTLAALVDAVTASAFVIVGFAVRRRPVTGQDRAAVNGFVTWWWAMAAYMALEAGISLAAALGAVPVLAATLVQLASVSLVALGTWGLTYYLLYLYSGWRGWSPLLGTYLTLVAVAYALMTVLGHPVDVTAGAYQVTLVHEREPPAVLSLLLGASFAVPILVGSVAYLMLLRRLEDPWQRYRVLLVGLSLIVWVSAGWAGQLGAGERFRYASVTLLGLVVAINVLLAYHPPRQLKDRWRRGATAEP